MTFTAVHGMVPTPTQFGTERSPTILARCFSGGNLADGFVHHPLFSPAEDRETALVDPRPSAANFGPRVTGTSVAVAPEVSQAEIHKYQMRYASTKEQK